MIDKVDDIVQGYFFFYVQVQVVEGLFFDEGGQRGVVFFEVGGGGGVVEVGEGVFGCFVQYVQDFDVGGLEDVEFGLQGLEVGVGGVVVVQGEGVGVFVDVNCGEDEVSEMDWGVLK